MQADAVPRRDGVTAAFRSKTRRLLPLPRPCRPRASHSWAQRPSWSLILTWRMELSQRRSTSPLSTCILMLNRRVRCRNVAGTDHGCPVITVGRSTLVRFCCAHSSAASERAASYTHRAVRPWVPRWPSGLSTATLRDDIGLSQRSAACSRRNQRWGHRHGRLGRYTVA